METDVKVEQQAQAQEQANVQESNDTSSSVNTLIADATRSQTGSIDQWPKPSPVQSRFLNDILEHLDSAELTLLNSVYTDNVNQGCGNQVALAKEVMSLSAM